LLFAPGPGICGICGSGSGEPRHELRLLAGYSPFSTTLIGTATDRQFGLAEVSYSQRCWWSNFVSLSYTAGIEPAAVLRQPQQTETIVSNQGILTMRNLPAHAVYGFAVMPVGFFAQFARHLRVHPVAELNGGIIASTEPIPEPGVNATGLNFFFDIGGGVRWELGSHSAVTAGYRFLHISNANTTSFNPGLDNNVFYASYSFLW
jgi:hypothetical protein